MKRAADSGDGFQPDQHRDPGYAGVVNPVRRLGLPVEELPDETLLEGFGRGDEEMTVAFVRRFQSKVFGVALAVSGDSRAAEDLAQQTFEKAWRHASTFDPRRGSVPGWLSTIARNMSIDSVRVRRPLPVDADDLLQRVAGGGRSTEASAIAGESATRLRAASRAPRRAGSCRGSGRDRWTLGERGVRTGGDTSRYRQDEDSHRDGTSSPHPAGIGCKP